MSPADATGAIDVVRERRVLARDLDPSVACSRRSRVLVEGTVTEVTFSPVDETPRYRAVLSLAPEATGCGAADASVELSWHGRRAVPGVITGTRLRCVAVVSFVDSVPTMYNPRYEIITAKRTLR